MRIGIIDDSNIFGRTLKRLVDREADFETVSVIASGAELATLAAAAPELVFLDVHLGREYGIDLLPELLAGIEGVDVIVLTAEYSPEVAEAALAAGARACFTKDHIVPLLRSIADEGLEALAAPAAEIGRVAPH